MSLLNIYYGTYESYSQLLSHDDNSLYFIDGVVYKGDIPYSTTIKKVSSLPLVGVQGILYLLPDYSLYFYNGTDYTTVNVGVIGIIDNNTDNDDKIVTQAAIKAYVQNYIITETTIDNKILESKNQAIASSNEYTDNELEKAKSDMENIINNKVSSVFVFKGTKNTYSELSVLTDMIVGDVWSINEDGKEYVYTGEDWELLGFNVDLSSYATIEEVTNAINNKAAEIISQINAYSKTEVDTLIKNIDDKLSTHTSNSNLHVSTSDRENWNNKATVDQISTAKTEAITTANKYTDEQILSVTNRIEPIENAVIWKTL